MRSGWETWCWSCRSPIVDRLIAYALELSDGPTFENVVVEAGVVTELK